MLTGSLALNETIVPSGLRTKPCGTPWRSTENPVIVESALILCGKVPVLSGTSKTVNCSARAIEDETSADVASRPASAVERSRRIEFPQGSLCHECTPKAVGWKSGGLRLMTVAGFAAG